MYFFFLHDFPQTVDEALNFSSNLHQDVGARADKSPVVEVKDDSGENLQSKSKLIVSMSLCVSKEAQKAVFRRTSEKPYDKAVALATRLWLQQEQPGVEIQVVVGLVNKLGDSKGVAEAMRLEKLLKDSGAQTWLYSYDGPGDANRACVYGSQLSRVFAHKSSHSGSDDWIIASDVDVFPINVTQILHPILKDNQNAEGDNYIAYVSSHDRTMEFLNFVATHLITFTAMKHQHWDAMWQKSNLTLTTAIESVIKDRDWNSDQILVTSALANAGYCTFPNPEHKFYERCRNFLLKSPQEMALVNDTQTCNKGRDKSERAWCTGTFTSKIPERCRWMHFESSANETLLEMHYDNIVSRYHSRSIAKK